MASTQQEAVLTLAQNVEKITKLVIESRQLAREHNLAFTLENLDLHTRDELYDSGWSDSNC